MNGSDLQRLETIVGDLLALAPEDRARRLSALVESGDPLAGVVGRLMARHERSAGLLAAPPDDGCVPAGFEPLIDPLVGRRVGDFVLRRLVGVGGMGRVYEAEQESPSRRVAVKVMAGAMLAGSAALARFRREAQLLGTLDHPGLCRVITAGSATVGGEIVAYIAMEFVEGRPLSEAGARLETREKLELMARVCDAAHEAHRHGIVHRDLKPANVMVRCDGQSRSSAPVILDFGVGKVLREAGATVSLETAPGELVGTLAYMSPEQLGSGKVDARADVYAIGVMLYELLAGRLPFESGATLAEAARLASSRQPPRLRTALPEIGADLEAVVGRALETDPWRRYHTAAELAEDLRRVLQARPVTARRWTVVYRAQRFLRRRRREALAVVLGIAVMAGGLGLALAGMGEAARARAQRDELARASAMEEYIADLHEAEADLRADDVAGARALLRGVAPERRGWEWHYLSVLCGLVEREIARTDRPVGSIAVHQAELIDAARIQIYFPFHDVARLYDDPPAIEVLDLTRHGEPMVRQDDLPAVPWRWGLSRDRRWLVLAGFLPGSVLHVYEVGTGRLMARRAGLEQEDHHVAINPAGTLVAIAGNSGVVRLFSVPELEPVGEIRPGGSLLSLDFSFDGERLLTGYQPDGLAVFRLDTLERIAQLETRGGKPLHAVFSDDATRVVSLNDNDTNLSLWDVATGRLLRRQPIPEGPMSLVRIPGAARVAVGAYDGAVRLFPTEVPEAGVWASVLTLREVPATVHVLAASPDGTALMAYTHDGRARIWSIAPDWRGAGAAGASGDVIRQAPHSGE